MSEAVKLRKKHKPNTLNINVHNPDKKIEQDVMSLAREIGIKRPESRNALMVLLFNFYFSGKTRVKTPLDKKGFGPKRYNPHKMGDAAYRKALKCLLDNGYIKQDKGFKEMDTWEGVTTTSWSTAKLRKFFVDCQWSESRSWNFAYQNEYILLRENNEKKRLVDYQDTPQSNKMRELLERYNELLWDTSITLVKKDKKTGLEDEYKEIYDFIIQRKFIQHRKDEYGVELGYGGRMYGPWCSLNSGVRKHIRLDGEKTIELDLPASAINTLYVVRTGEKYPDGDPYYLEINDLEIPRHIVKKTLNIMFNTDSKKTAAGALDNYYLPNHFNDTRSKDELQKSKHYIAVKGFIRPLDIINAIIEKHQTVKEYFLRGKRFGDRITWYESDRVLEIIRRFTDRNIPILTVYDSFIVQEKYQENLERLMEKLNPLRLG